jgi:hypothetical protein
MVRARRVARNVPKGAEVLEFLSGAKGRKLLVATAADGDPPVSAISGELAKILSAKDLKLTPVKQFVGLAVRAVLEEEGYEVARTGVWLGDDPVFSTGAVYQKSAQPRAADADDFLERFVEMLSEAEMGRAVELIQRRRGSKKT